VLLSELTAADERLALVGLAKNTGKTVALTALLHELAAAERTVGVTSVGRDGEEHDVIDFRIAKPRVGLRAGSLVATTDELLRASGLPADVLASDVARTPLGRVLVARLRAAGTVEVAGPSAAADVRAVSDTMLAHGASQVLIDGAIDRRAASSPQVADALVISTGAVLSEDLGEVVERTRDAVELARLPALEADASLALRLEALAGRSSALLDASAEHQLGPRFVLTADAAALEAALDAAPQAGILFVAGALPEPFLLHLVRALRRRSRELTVLVADATHVFLSSHGPDWYSRQALHLRALRPIAVRALTVNPVAPRSHEHDSVQLRAMLTAAIPQVPTFDVMHPSYTALQPAPHSPISAAGNVLPPVARRAEDT
jgi:hypothetical protein